jgi:hypothetical protein
MAMRMSWKRDITGIGHYLLGALVILNYIIVESHLLKRIMTGMMPKARRATVLDGTG